jgi:hypothetical protein
MCDNSLDFMVVLVRKIHRPVNKSGSGSGDWTMCIIFVYTVY